MAVKIRLKRVGSKKKPFYRIVVTDSRNARDGKVIEELGSYNPKSSDNSVDINSERAAEWIKNGAQPTDTVRSLLKISGIIPSDKNAGEPVATESAE
ncbi:MAG: 30S ribosomal protein S16 [Clostridia bacterium]|jgi:small subunit ribosomal protein S16|nr:30S ribosomal protein S16 [Clostridiaceae bacterium]